MIELDTDPVFYKMRREKDLNVMIDWIENRKHLFYKLCWNYVKNPPEIQDIFHRVMNRILTEIRQQKKNTSFDTWVYSLFLQECRAKSVEKAEMPTSSLERLDASYKEPIILTYVVGLSHDESANILQISVKEVKDRLHKGIQQISGMEEGHYQENFLDYLNRTLQREKKIELEIHLHGCQSCQLALSAFQETIYRVINESEAIKVPVDLLDSIIANLQAIDEQKQLKKKKRKTASVVTVIGITLILILGYVTNSFSYAYYTWLDWRGQEDEELLAFYKSGISEPLNLVQENNGVKITIKAAIADDNQTLLYYELESLEDNESYAINFADGVMVENESEIINLNYYPMYHFPSYENVNEEGVYQGKLGLHPISKESGTIKLKIMKVEKVTESLAIPTWFSPESETETIRGDWSFEIPVVKQPSIEVELNEDVVVDGATMMFEKLILSPTSTVLQYMFDGDVNHQKSINNINIEKIETDETVAKADSWMGMYPNPNGSMDEFSYHLRFDSLYFTKPNEIDIHLSSIDYSVQDNFTFQIDNKKDFPQTFEYLGSEISIDKVETGGPSKIEIAIEMSEDRKFEQLFVDLVDQNMNPITAGMMNSDAVLMDRDGKTFNREEYNFFEHLDAKESPRYYQTKYVFEMHGDENPGALTIQGYTSTTYLDEVVNIKIK
ncbi:DUF4179 domain-containing protein [Ferdinandcohnia sp. Marseille-Q9671]